MCYILRITMLLFIVQIPFSAIESCGHTTDSLQKSKIRYFSPGKGGQNKIWDFSNKLRSKEAARVYFDVDSTGVLSVSEPGKISYYRTAADSLLLIGIESPLEKRIYGKSRLARRFPLEYGDSVCKDYRCDGMYCGDHPFREAGTTTVKVDAEGSVILAENDTIRNVRRVHTIDSYSVCMDIDSVALDTARLTQVIDERYEWYLADSEYPFIEDVTSTTYDNMSIVGTTKYAYCNLPEGMADSYVSPDDETESDEQAGFAGEDHHTADIIHYQIAVQGKTVQMAYSLEAEATIQTIVANHMGMLCNSRQWTQQAGQNYSVQIDCYGLPAGMYILYINVNGKVYSEKVTL